MNKDDIDVAGEWVQSQIRTSKERAKIAKDQREEWHIVPT